MRNHEGPNPHSTLTRFRDRAMGAVLVVLVVLLGLGCVEPPPPETPDRKSTSARRMSFGQFMESPVAKEYYRLQKLGRKRQALAQLQRMIIQARVSLGSRHPMIAMFSSWRAKLLAEVGGPLAAARAYELELRRWKASLGGSLNPIVASAHFRVGRAYSNAGVWPKAAHHLERCLAIRLRLLSGKPVPAAKRGRVASSLTIGPKLAGVYSTVLLLSWTLGKAGRPADAIQHLLVVYRLARAAGPTAASKDPNLPRLLVALGVGYSAVGKAADAVKWLSAALPGLRKHDGPSSPVTIRATKLLVGLYTKLGRSADAARVRAFLKAIPR